MTPPKATEEEMREAMRLAKEALQLEIDRYLAEGEVPMKGESRRIQMARKALATLEKVMR